MTAVISSLQYVYLLPSLKLVQMVSCIVPSRRKDPSELCKVQICEKGRNKFRLCCWWHVTGQEPECYKAEHRSCIVLHKQRVFNSLRFLLGHLFWVIVVILCDKHLNIRRFGQPLPKSTGDSSRFPYQTCMECVPTTSFCRWFYEQVVILLVYSGGEVVTAYCRQ